MSNTPFWLLLVTNFLALFRQINYVDHINFGRTCLLNVSVHETLAQSDGECPRESLTTILSNMLTQLNAKLALVSNSSSGDLIWMNVPVTAHDVVMVRNLTKTMLDDEAESVVYYFGLLLNRIVHSAQVVTVSSSTELASLPTSFDLYLLLLQKPFWASLLAVSLVLNLVLVYKLVTSGGRQRRLLSTKHVNGSIKGIQTTGDYDQVDAGGDDKIDDGFFADLEGDIIGNKPMSPDTMSVHSFSSTTTNCSHLFDSSRLNRFGVGQPLGTSFLTPLSSIRESTTRYLSYDDEDSFEDFNNPEDEVD